MSEKAELVRVTEAIEQVRVTAEVYGASEGAPAITRSRHYGLALEAVAELNASIAALVGNATQPDPEDTVECARCGRSVGSDVAVPEEGDEWECQPCNRAWNEVDSLRAQVKKARDEVDQLRAERDASDSLNRELAAALSEARAQLKAAQWVSVSDETRRPTKRERVLCYWPGAKNTVGGPIDTVLYVKESHTPFGGREVTCPTYWMPLPAPPPDEC